MAVIRDDAAVPYIHLTTVMSELESETAVRLCLERLESLLSREFGGRGKHLAERIENADLPLELRGALREIARRADSESGDSAETFDLVFRCGQLHEKLETLAFARIVEPFSHVQVDVTPGPEIEDADIAHVAQAIKALREFMRRVTDFVLKLLLVGVIVGFIAVFFGVI